MSISVSERSEIDVEAIEDFLRDVKNRAKRQGVACSGYWNEHGFIEIVWLRRDQDVEPGTAAKFLEEICLFADRHGLPMELCAKKGNQKLVDYYKRFAFEPAMQNGRVLFDQYGIHMRRMSDMFRLLKRPDAQDAVAAGRLRP